MSFVRRGHDSDVYVYESDLGYECSRCQFAPLTPIFFLTKQGIIHHLIEHKERGHKVPIYAFVQILEHEK